MRGSVRTTGNFLNGCWRNVQQKPDFPSPATEMPAIDQVHRCHLSSARLGDREAPKEVSLRSALPNIRGLNS